MKPTWRVVAVVVALVAVACSGDLPEPEDTGCNGAPHLCERRFDQVVYATTHNSMSNEEEGWLGPNQTWPMTRQLEDGVRALMLDTYRWQDQTYLCHGLCSLGSRLLVDGLLEIKAFLDAHPREVVSILFEPYVSASETATAFADAGLLDRLHTQAAGEPWPTLGEMIASGRRLVVFTQDHGGEPAWHHRLWDFAWDTHWAARTPEELDCVPNRGRRSNGIFLLNHFLTDPLPSPALARQVNHNPFLRERVRACETANERRVNFIAVDFHDIGDLLEVVAELNARDVASTF